MNTGQPRIGDANFAALVESLFAKRWRITSNADLIPQTPPRQLEWAAASRLLALAGNQTGLDVQALTALLDAAGIGVAQVIGVGGSAVL